MKKSKVEDDDEYLSSNPSTASGISGTQKHSFNINNFYPPAA